MRENGASVFWSSGSMYCTAMKYSKNMMMTSSTVRLIKKPQRILSVRGNRVS